MRIAQVAPLQEAVPPRFYGGTERVVSYLTENLVQLGHDVTLFASGDSETRARLVPICQQALRLDPDCQNPVPYEILGSGSRHPGGRRLRRHPFPRGLFAPAMDPACTVRHGHYHAWSARPARSRTALSRVRRRAVGLDLGCPERTDAVGKLARHGVPRSARRPLSLPSRAGRISRLPRPDLPGEAGRSRDRHRPSAPASS